MPQETISQEKARAYAYHGEWIADCPRPGCNSAEFLFRPSRPGGVRDRMIDFFLCSNCGMQAFIDWPRFMNEIMQVLVQRPLPDTRNWYPKDHPVAVRFRIAHGQSVKELIEESEEHGVTT